MNPNNSENNIEQQKGTRSKHMMIKLGIAALSLTAVLSGTMCSAIDKGPSNIKDDTHSDRVPSITSVTIEEGANIRSDHFVKRDSDESANNLVEKTDEQMIITIDDSDARVYEDKDNGGWYGIPVEDIKKVDPKFDDKGDKDGFVWVNSQKAKATPSEYSANQ